MPKLVGNGSILRIGPYRSHKGEICAVLGVAENPETGEQMVIYSACKKLWIYPVLEFLEQTRVGGRHVRKFEFIGEQTTNKVL